MYFEFETKTMSETQLDKFVKEYDRKIGTDREINDIGGNQFFVVCVDLLENELEYVESMNRSI